MREEAEKDEQKTPSFCSARNGREKANGAPGLIEFSRNAFYRALY